MFLKDFVNMGKNELLCRDLRSMNTFFSPFEIKICYCFSVVLCSVFLKPGFVRCFGPSLIIPLLSAFPSGFINIHLKKMFVSKLLNNLLLNGVQPPPLATRKKVSPQNLGFISPRWSFISGFSLKQTDGPFFMG